MIVDKQGMEKSTVDYVTRKIMRVDPDKEILKNCTERELVKLVKTYDYILDVCDGMFSANQECMLMDMRNVFTNEIELREVE